MKREQLEALCEIAVKAAREAGQMIRERAQSDFEVEHKDSGSHPASQVVTEVDLKAQKIILEHVHPTLGDYDLGLLTEEETDDGSRFEKSHFWCIDPMDGTLNFVEGRPGYCVSIALVSQAGTPCLGVVYDPVGDVLYQAVKGGGAMRNGVPWEPAPVNADTSFEVIPPAPEGLKAAAENIEGAVMSALRVLERAPACFVKRPKMEEGGGCLWDYAATACVFQEVGAYVADYSVIHHTQTRRPSL